MLVIRSRRRAVAAALFGALLGAAGCDADAPSPPSSDRVVTDGAPTTTVPADGDGGAPASSRPIPGRSTTTARRGTAGPTPTTTGATGATVTTTMTAPADESWSGPAGSYARTLLRPAPATAITIELLSEDGDELRDASAAHLESVLEAVSRKQVTRGATSLGGASKRTWTADDLVALADARARVRPQHDRAVVHVLAVTGRFADDSVLGVALRGDLFAVFTDTVDRAGSALVPAARIEEAIVAHEIGHLLGLVDIVVDRNRDDPEHPFHSRNRGSVMYWAIESDLVGQILGGPPPRDFDADDLADLGAIRSGA